jgi:large subunit ribosomal protein L4
MESILYNQNGENIGKIEISKDIFGLPMNRDLVYQVATSQLSNARQSIANAKGRGEVRGGGKKPWRQKGTGRARHGSIRSPIWKGGGVTHGPTKEKDYTKIITKKMGQKALKVAISGKLTDGEMLFVDEIKINQPKTKEMAGVFKNITKEFKGSGSGKVLVVLGSGDKKVLTASNNIKNLDVIEARNLSLLDILNHKNLIISKDGVEKLTSRFSK